MKTLGMEENIKFDDEIKADAKTAEILLKSKPETYVVAGKLIQKIEGLTGVETYAGKSFKKIDNKE